MNLKNSARHVTETTNERKAPKISVIVPIYKVERYIRTCVETLFAQSWQNLEYIFVDDGSPDESVEILLSVLNEFPERKPQTRIIRQENKGLPEARMSGLAAATGDYIIHVDSDDWVEPEFIARMAKKILSEAADVVYCDFWFEYKNKPPKIKREADISPNTGAAALKAMHNSKIRAYMWNKLIKRSLYDLNAMVVPPFGYHEDLVFQTQILFNARKCIHLNEALYHYRYIRKGSLTRSSLLDSRLHSARNMLHLYDSLPKETGPLSVCGIDILMRTGWYLCATLNFRELYKHPDVVKILAEKPSIHGCRVPVFKQVFTKFCCKLLRHFRKI
jgi:glycosyltransferase involved in cell wall biosynthesis